MWTPEESDRIQRIAREIVPEIRTFALPYGMQIEKGPSAVVEHVKQNLDDIINGDLGLSSKQAEA